MEADRFDTITRTLGAAPSRRNIAQALAGLTLAGGLGTLAGLNDADARKRKRKKKKKKKGAASGNCKPACGGATPTCCAGACVNTATNERNCGSCGETCPPGQTCCGGTCANLATDEANCSACGASCGAGQACCGGVCLDTSEDPENCGGCGTACGANAVCEEGACACPPDTLACNGQCACYYQHCGCATDLECQSRSGNPQATCSMSMGQCVCGAGGLCVVPCPT